MLECSDKDLKTSLIKMIQQEIVKSLEINKEKEKSQQKHGINN
jgi:hypothetical protein